MGTGKVLLLTLGIMLAVCCGGSAIVAAVNSGKTTNTSSRNGGDTPAAGGSVAATPTGAAGQGRVFLSDEEFLAALEAGIDDPSALR